MAVPVANLQMGLYAAVYLASLVKYVRKVVHILKIVELIHMPNVILNDVKRVSVFVHVCI